MPRNRAALRIIGVIASVLLLLAIVFGLLSYLYVLDEQDYLTKRDFRLLGVLSTQVKLRVENYSGSVVINIAEDALKTCLRRIGPPVPKATRCVERAVQQEGDPRSGVPTTAPTTSSVEGPRNPAEAQRDPHLQECFKKELQNLLSFAPDLKLVGDVGFSLVKSPTPVTVQVSPKQAGDSYQLQFEYRGGKEGYSVTFRVIAKWDDLAGTIGRGVFDDILIVSQEPGKDDNTVIFQQAPSGPRITELLKVQNMKGDEVKFRDIRYSADIFKLNFAGTEYRLFLQPLRLSTYSRDATGALLSETRCLGGDWTICGLVRTERFRAESLAISYSALLVALFVFMMVTASWPLLKLWSLGPADQLGLAHVISVCISVLMINGLLTFFLLDFYAYQQLEQRLDQQLCEFATHIAERFECELKRLQGLLDRMLDHMKVSQSGQWTEEETESKAETSILCPQPDNCPPNWLNADDPYFQMMTLVRATDGMQIRKWTINRRSTPFVNVSERAYFRNINEGRGWTRESGGKEFFLEPIFSVNTGKTLAELSMPGPGWHELCSPKCVVTLTAELISLRKTVVPPGFGYAVIDDTGKTLFHSDLSRTLAENFLEECDNRRELKALVYARGSDWVNAQYMGQGRRLYAKPVKDLPLMLVVFRDKEFAQTANLELLSASLILYIFYALVFLSPALLLSLRHLEWMWPNPDSLADYRHLLAANSAFIVLSLTEYFVYQYFVPHHHVPTFAFVLPPFALLVNWLKLKNGVHVPQLDGAQKVNLQYSYFLALIVPLVLLLALCCRDSKVTGWVERLVGTVAQAVLLCGLFLFVFYPQKFFFPRILQFFESRLKRLSPSFAYLLVAISLVALVSVLPALVFFRSAHDSEMEIFVKHGQLHLARALAERDQRVKADYRDVLKPPGYLKERLAPGDDIYEKFFFKTALKDRGQTPENVSCPAEEHLFEWAMEAIRPLYNNVALETHELMHDAAADCSFQWAPGRGNVRLVKGPAGDFLPMRSEVPVLGWPNSFGWWFGLVAMIVLVCVTVYLLVRFVANKIFLLGLLAPRASSAKIKDLGDVNENTLVLGMPHSGKSELLARPGFHFVDLRQIVAAGTWQEALTREIPRYKKVVAIDHLEYHMDDPECNGQKLRLLEKFILADRVLVVASTIDPMDFPIRASFQNKHQEGEHNGAILSEMEQDHLASHFLDRWAAVWSKFTRRVHAVKEEGTEVKEDELRMAVSRSQLSPVCAKELRRECKPTARLRNIGMEIAALPHRADLNREELVLEVLDRARAYYRALWATCSQEEKLALFDLAQDGFVNARSMVLRRLLEKELILRDPDLQLMNKSFRRFVRESKSLEKVSSLWEGAWSPWPAVRRTLIGGVSVVALIVFLTQPQLLNVSMAFIGAISAGIPALLNLVNLIRGTRKRE